jgi:hypothetical protein
MGTKGFLLTRWGLALGFLGAMGICTNAVAETASYAIPQPDTPGPALAAVWTKADCYNAWKYNMMGCNASPPNLRPACWAAASALLTACLAASEG